MSLVIVSDASPLINLAIVGKLSIIPDLFKKIFLPPSVYEEICLLGEDQPGAKEIEKANWIEVREIEKSYLLDILQLNLDPGEAEAIYLALKLEADLLLIDERKGRKRAICLDLKVLGLLGILLQAKRKNIISKVSPIIDDLTSQAGFYMSDKLRQRVLEEAGEAE